MSQNNVQLQNGNGPLAGLRNQVINGDFHVWQRTSTPSTGLSVPPNVTTFTADRWSITSVTSTSMTSRQGRTAWEGETITDMTLESMSGRTWVGTTIELNTPGYVSQFGAGSKWILSLVSSSTTAPEQLLITFSDKSGSSRTESSPLSYTPWALIETSGSTYRYATEITIDQAALPSSVCLYFQFRFADSKTDLDFANVQLEPGPIATPFEKRSTGLELMLCQRYFIRKPVKYREAGVIRGYRSVAGSGTTKFTVPYLSWTNMRTTPTASCEDMGAGVDVVSTPNTNSSTTYTFSVTNGGIAYLNPSGTGEAGYVTVDCSYAPTSGTYGQEPAYINQTMGAYFDLDAEL